MRVWEPSSPFSTSPLSPTRKTYALVRTPSANRPPRPVLRLPEGRTPYFKTLHQLADLYRHGSTSFYATDVSKAALKVNTLSFAVSSFLPAKRSDRSVPARRWTRLRHSKPSEAN